MITSADVDLLAQAAQSIPPAEGSYVEENFILNLQETVLDYMMSTTAVIRALEHFNEHRSTDIRTIDDLEQVIARFPEDRRET